MNLKKRLAVLAALAATVTGTALAGAPAAAAQEAPSITIANGQQIALWESWEPGQSFCTIGAVGTDKYGNNVGITAGHCWGTDDHANDEVLQPMGPAEGATPIYAADNMDWNPDQAGRDPIAYLRWAKDGDGNAGGHVGKDYAVIQFVDGVKLSSQGKAFKMTGIHELPNGTIKSPYVGNRTALPEEKVLGSGIFSNHTLITAGQVPGAPHDPGHAASYGRITNNSATGTVGVYQSWASHLPGDSGGPAIIADPGTALPSTANGFTVTGKWVGITRGSIIGAPPYTYTSSANILADLRSRDIASGEDGSVVGAGFQVTTNP